MFTSFNMPGSTRKTREKKEKKTDIVVPYIQYNFYKTCTQFILCTCTKLNQDSFRLFVSTNYIYSCINNPLLSELMS